MFSRKDIADDLLAVYGCVPWKRTNCLDLSQRTQMGSAQLIKTTRYSWIAALCPKCVALVLGLSLSDFRSETSFGNLKASTSQVLAYNF